MGKIQRENLPFITCICPTYKRPEMLRNVLACFVNQNYPKDKMQLLILDDGGHFASSYVGFPNRNDYELAIVRLFATTYGFRYKTLPDKFNKLFWSAPKETEVFCVWEDDDIYLP